MKSFILGVLASIVSAGIIYWITELYSTYYHDVQISYIVEDNAYKIDKSAVYALKSLKENSTISTLNIKNDGKSDIQNAIFHISSEINNANENSFSFVTSTNCGDDVKIETKYNDISVNIPLFKASSTCNVFIVNDGNEIFKLSSRVPNASLKDKKYASDDDLPDLWSLMKYALIALVSLTIGIFIGGSIYEEMLKKIGLDPKEVTEEFKKLTK